jgi:hypothetical protein
MLLGPPTCKNPNLIAVVIIAVDRAIAPAVSQLPPIVAVRIRYQVMSCGIFCGLYKAGKDFLPVFRNFLKVTGSIPNDFIGFIN